MTLFDWADTVTESTAWISECGRYRYALGRRWSSERPATFVMLNPSTADAHTDDPTIRRCIGFAKAWGCGGLVVVNLYALRSTDPSGLWSVDDPVGPENDEAIARQATMRDGRPLIAAWGANARQDRVDQVLALPGTDRLECLGTTKAGAPRHPLYLRGGTRAMPWPTTLEEENR